MAIGTNIKNICLEKGISLKELSKRSGISVNTIYTLTREDPENARGDTLAPIAKTLNVPVDVLLGRNAIKDWAVELSPTMYNYLNKYFYEYENLDCGVSIKDISGEKYYLTYEEMDDLEKKLQLWIQKFFIRELEKYKKDD